MGKVNASLADVSTEFVQIASGDYEMKVTEVDESKWETDKILMIKSVVDQPGNEEYGKPIFDRIHGKKKDGTENEMGYRTIKRYFIAICGEDRANADYLDFDELKNGRFRGIISQYTYKKNPTDVKEKVGTQLDDILALS